MRAMAQRTREPLSGAGAAGRRDGGAPDLLSRLFGDLATGRTRALEGIYGACADEIYGLALWRTGSADDAADVVQEVFVRLAEARTRLGGVRNPLAYLRRMTHRASIDVHRKRARRREQPLEACRFVEAAGESPERHVDAERISGFLSTLPAPQREAVFLRYLAGCSFAEIGRATGVPTFTAASRCRLAMRRLKRLAGVDHERD
jgi:RNA polymerase sigma-70 factor (ECF subfamily)